MVKLGSGGVSPKAQKLNQQRTMAEAKAAAEAVGRRTTIKNRLNAIQTAVNKHDDEDTVLIPETARTHLMNIKRYFLELETLESVINVNVTGSDLTPHADPFERAYNLATLLEGRLQVILNNFPKLPPPPTPIEVKLPKLDLPKFGGNLCDWLSFRDLFYASIHHSKSLTAGQKLQYLKSSLEGEPERLLKSFQPTDTNYLVALQTLEERYENTRELILHQLSILTRQPAMSSDSAVQLRTLIDTTQECARALEVLKQPVNQWDAVLIHLVLERLTPESRQDWELNFKSTTLPTFIETVIHLEARARALGASTIKSVKVLSKPKSVSSHAGTVNSPPRCKVCNNEHYLNNCEVFLNMSVTDRIANVKSFHLCFNCFSTKHSVEKCTNKYKCRHCSKSHHTLLHIEKKPEPSDPPLPTSPQPPPAASEVVSAHQAVVSTQQVLLSTALIKVYDQSGHPHVCRALLDGGCHVSMITERLAQRLRLPRKDVSVGVSGIGATSCGYIKHQIDICFQSLVDPNFVCDLSVYVLSRVTKDLPLQRCLSTWPAIKDLTLADPQFFSPGAIDVLIGADVLASIMQDGRRMGPPGYPVAQKSTLGWVLSGPIPECEREISSNLMTTDIQAAPVHSSFLSQSKVRRKMDWSSNKHLFSNQSDSSASSDDEEEISKMIKSVSCHSAVLHQTVKLKDPDPVFPQSVSRSGSHSRSNSKSGFNSVGVSSFHPGDHQILLDAASSYHSDHPSSHSQSVSTTTSKIIEEESKSSG